MTTGDKLQTISIVLAIGMQAANPALGRWWRVFFGLGGVGAFVALIYADYASGNATEKATRKQEELRRRRQVLDLCDGEWALESPDSDSLLQPPIEWTNARLAQRGQTWRVLMTRDGLRRITMNDWKP